MATLRGDINFRYLKQFFLVFILLVANYQFVRHDINMTLNQLVYDGIKLCEIT